ncbi:MAG: aspartate aminotransferase family protein [Planctomycetota bacterium]|nr:MAG: aspartate aminotransferase family protein [Planctomycetota bacterium]
MVHSYLTPNYRRNDLCFSHGEGVWLHAEDGTRYLDALSGIAVNALGHAHPALTQAIREQAGQLLHTSNIFRIGPQESLAQTLCEHSFAEQVYFCNSGAEGNEAAYKVARLWSNQVHAGRKPRLVAAEGGFHGRTIGALTVTANPAYREPFAPLPEVTFVPYGDAQALADAMDDQVAALWLEPLQGEGGVRVPPKGYLARARALCDQHQSLLVFDEVQVGCGRLGTLFGYEGDGVVPDIMVLAKGLGGGVPIGAMLARRSLGELLQPGTHASTFGGNHLACAAGCAVLKELLRPGFLTQVQERGAQLAAGLERLFAGRCRQVRGRGLLWGVALDEAPGPLVAAALQQGLVCGAAGDNVLRLAPPLIISEREVEELLQRLGAALGSLTAGA